ncbi:MAG: hypothetical protein KF874_06200 [Rhizobiaceae bacterium]|nr:hypothetical protein [Rhizobiaceae bacterium]
MDSSFKIDAPTSDAKSPSYDRECRLALKPAFEALLDVASEAGWDRKRVAYEMMYLASHSIAERNDMSATA